MKSELLKNLCKKDSIGKYGIPASAEDFEISKYRYLRISDISDDGNLLDSDKRSVSADDIEKYILEEGDLVVARTGNSTGRTYFHEKKNGKLAFAGFLIKYGLDEKKVNPKYLKFFTISNEYKNWVKNLSGGSTRGNINAQTFADCPISLPNRKQQDDLVKILSAISDKIELNQKLNRELESLAKTLYDYWFVQFDFPDADGKPYKTSGGPMVFSEVLGRDVPVGWEVGNLGDLTKPKNVQLTKAKMSADLNYVGLEHIPRKSLSLFDFETAEDLGSNKSVFEKGDILFGKLRPYFHKVCIAPVGGVCSTDILVIQSKEKAFFANVLFQIFSDDFIAFASATSGGTKMPRTKWQSLATFPMVLPKKELAQKFSKFAEPIFSQLIENIIETRHLTHLRDFLLPLLMNGQVQVK